MEPVLEGAEGVSGILIQGLGLPWRLLEQFVVEGLERKEIFKRFK